MALVNVEKLGGEVLRSFTTAYGAYTLLIGVFVRLRTLANRAVRGVLLRQIYFTGIEAMGKVLVIGTFIGVVIVLQTALIAGTDAALIGKILAWVVIRELGPLLAAILIIARSTTAIASELGSMKIHGQTNWLRTMGIDPFAYLIVPRVVGTTLCMIVLTLYFQTASVVGGTLLAGLFVPLPAAQTLKNLFLVVGYPDITVSFVKSALFGLITAAVSCYHGLQVRSSITEIPQATSAAVIQAMTLVIMADAIVTMLSVMLW